MSTAKTLTVAQGAAKKAKGFTHVTAYADGRVFSFHRSAALAQRQADAIRPDGAIVLTVKAL